MATYKLNADVEVYSDCTWASTVIGTITSGTTVEVTTITNGWYYTSSGWFYGFNGTTVLVERVNDGTTIAVGSYVTFNNTSGSIVYDVDQNILTTSVTSGTFVVTAIDEKNSTVTISNGTNQHTVSQSLLKLSGSTVVEVPAEVATGAGNTTTNNNFNTNDTSQSSATNLKLSVGALRINTLRGVFGMPYQYMDIADRRIDSNSDSFGAIYAEKIVAQIPLLIMVPGVPEFLAGYSKQEKEGAVNYMLGLMDSIGNKTDLDSLVGHEGKFYALKPDWPSYFMHVSPMCRAAARFLNIHNKSYYGKTLGSYSWENESNEKIHEILNYKGGVAFYLNSETQISDSFGNSTGQSMVASKVNSISDMGREMNFLLGGAGALTGMQADKFTNDKKLAQNEQNKQDMSSKIASASGGISGLIGSITNGLSTVIAGGKLMFPEIWNDSQFSRDYDVNVKLVSPDCDSFSIYLNIIVPLLHLIGFVCPRSVGPNGYISPFLVRAFYKGMFNCDMGIITNMSISKGGEGCWTPYGIPTEVDVRFTIKELYGTMAITADKSLTSKGLLGNIILMDYIANLCGININEPDLKRTLYFYYSQYVTNKFMDKIYTQAIGGLEQWATNAMLNLFRSN